jgi:heptosyltransferase-2
MSTPQGIGPSRFSAQERILIVEVNWLGDVLFSTPAIRAIRKKYPGAYIAALVVPRAKAVLSGNNYLDEVIALDEEGRHKGFFGILRLIRELKVRRFTITYLFHRSLTRSWVVFCAGIKKRIGYYTRKRGFLLTEKVMPLENTCHRADTYYYLVAKTFIPNGERYCDFFVSSSDKSFIADFLNKHHLGVDRKLAVLHIGGNWVLKCWPKENFAELIDMLRERFGADVIISGSFLEYPLAREIASLTQHKPFIACGLTTLQQLGALFQKSDVVISADSGPLHIAMAVEAHTIALFGPTSAKVTGPFGRGGFSILSDKNNSCVIPCYNLECKDNVCMRSISVEQVASEAEKKGWMSSQK